MPTKNRQIAINKYIDVNWLVRLTDETTAQTVAQQSFKSFNAKINQRYLPKYEEANQIGNPKQRRAAHRKLDKQMAKEIKEFFGNYRKVTLDSLSNAKLGASRIQYQMLDEPVRKLRSKRESGKKVQKVAETRELQLGTGSQADPRKGRYRHKGSPDHMVDRYIIGQARDMRKVGNRWSAASFVRRTGPRFETVARTMAQGTIADADQQAIKETFKQYRYVAIIDENTTDRCEYLDGEVFDADDADGVRPPQHFNCRSELQPVSRDPARDKALQKASQTKFETWLKRQPPGTQRMVVGGANMNAYLAGEYKPKPQWNIKTSFYVDPASGQPVVPTKQNYELLDKRTRTVGVRFAEDF